MKKCILLLAITLVGCVNLTAKKPEFDGNKNITSLLSQYFEASQRGLISPYNISDPSGKNFGLASNGKYIEFRRWWCLDSKSSIDELKSLVEKHCYSKGGVYEEEWCSAKNSETPLYKAHIGKAFTVGKNDGTEFCRSGDDIGVIAIEKGNSFSDKQWIEFATSDMKYESPSQYRKRIKEEKDANCKKIVEGIKKQTEDGWAAHDSKRGTKICKDFKQGYGEYVYIGFLEDKTDEKMKISIVEAADRRNHSYTFADFRPSVIWDRPNGWYVCE